MSPHRDHARATFTNGAPEPGRDIRQQGHPQKTDVLSGDASIRRGVRKGRGAASNASGRFEDQTREDIDDGWGSLDEPAPKLVTTVTRDASRSVLSFNESPDVPFDRSVNTYRGCEHGCIYCYARPTHAWLGLSAGLDFESRLFVKHDAAALLRNELRRPGYEAATLGLGAITDPYQPIEKRLRVTREVLELLHGCDHPVRVTTKGTLVERDIDLLADMARRNLAQVHISVATLDRQLARRMEPRATAPDRRVETIRRLADAGIPVGIICAPVVPALNDAGFEAVLDAAREAGAIAASYSVLRLPHEVKGLWQEWLEAHYPLKAKAVMNQMRSLRGGKDYDPDFDQRMQGQGPLAVLLARRFELRCRALGFAPDPVLDAARFRAPAATSGQLGLFD